VKTRISVLLAVLLATAAGGQGTPESLDWLRGRSRHIPAHLGDSVVIEAKALGSEKASCEIDISLREVIPGKDAWWLLHEAGEDLPPPADDEEYILARFAITVLAKKGVKRFHVDDSLFKAVSRTGIVYIDDIALEKFEPNITADLLDGVQYEGWVCFKVRKDDVPVVVFGREWGRECEAYFSLRPEEAVGEPQHVAYKGQVRSGSWVRRKYRSQRRNYACADDVFVEVDTIPVSTGRWTRPRTPDDDPPSIEEIMRRVDGTAPPENAISRIRIIRGTDQVSRFNRIGDWGWISGTVFQILGFREMLVSAEDKLFHISGYTTDRLIDGSPFEAWITIVGTYRYATVRGGSRTVWDCRVRDMAFTYPITLEQFIELLQAGAELYRWEKEVKKCPECGGSGAVVRQRVVHRIVGNIANRRVVTETVPRRVKCPRCGGRGRISERWVRVKDY